MLVLTHVRTMVVPLSMFIFILQLLLKSSEKLEIDKNNCLKSWSKIILTHFMPLVSFDTPENIKKPGFLMFSAGIERNQWHEMG